MVVGFGGYLEQSTSDTILTEKKAQMQADVDGAGENGYNQKRKKGKSAKQSKTQTE